MNLPNGKMETHSITHFLKAFFCHVNILSAMYQGQLHGKHVCVYNFIYGLFLVVELEWNIVGICAFLPLDKSMGYCDVVVHDSPTST